MHNATPQAYYASHGMLTDPGPYGSLFDPLPYHPEPACATVNGIILHDIWIGLAGLKVSEERRQREINLRSVQQKVPRMLELDTRPLTEARPLVERFLGNCRDLSLMLCAMLRQHGTPARVRAGFATYFDPQGVKRQDHWVVECWSASQLRWVMVDPQMQQFRLEKGFFDSSMHGFLDSFPALDLPAGMFLTGGQAWQACRGGDDEMRYGIEGDLWGLWFVRNTMLRDLLCLNKIEPLPWDCWGVIDNNRNSPNPEEMDWLDHVAEVSVAADAAFDEVRALYDGNPGLRLPSGLI